MQLQREVNSLNTTAEKQSKPLQLHGQELQQLRRELEVRVLLYHRGTVRAFTLC